jgi:hypothetical protein
VGTAAGILQGHSGGVLWTMYAAAHVDTATHVDTMLTWLQHVPSRDVGAGDGRPSPLPLSCNHHMLNSCCCQASPKIHSSYAAAPSCPWEKAGDRVQCRQAQARLPGLQERISGETVHLQ